MINGLEGIPGSGKSYEAVVFHVLQALRRGRLVITNLPLNLEAFAAIDPAWLHLIEIRTKPLPVRGTWDADRTPAFQLFGPGEVEKNPRLETMPDGSVVALRPPPKLFGHVWDFYSEWKAEDGSGPLYIIDECHVGLPKVGTNPHVIEWYKLHRHFNADVLLGTQNFRDINSEVAGLLAMLIRVRKADILGRKDSYIRKVHAGFRGAVISTDERKYQKQFFGLYKSHTQGNSVSESMASDVKPMMVNFNRFKWAWLAVTAAFSVYAFWPAAEKPKVTKTVVITPATPAEIERMEKTGAVAPQSPASAVVVPEDLEPFRAQLIHLTGWMSMKGKTVYTFAVSFGGQRLFEFSEAQIARAGYKFEAMGDCVGLLRWGTKARTVICDAPTLALATNSAPVVLADGSRRSSAER